MQLLEHRFSFPLSVNESDPFADCDHREIVLKFPYLKRRTVIDLYNTVIGELFMFYKLSFSVLFDHFPDLVHSFDHKHLCISQPILCPIIIFLQKSIIFFKKLVDRIQEACKMVIDASAPYKSITVRIRLDLCTVNKKFPEKSNSSITFLRVKTGSSSGKLNSKKLKLIFEETKVNFLLP